MPHIALPLKLLGISTRPLFLERNAMGRVRKKLEVDLHNFSTTKWKQAKSGLVPGNSTINIVFMVKCVPIKSTL